MRKVTWVNCSVEKKNVVLVVAKVSITNVPKNICYILLENVDIDKKSKSISPREKFVQSGTSTSKMSRAYPCQSFSTRMFFKTCP